MWLSSDWLLPVAIWPNALQAAYRTRGCESLRNGRIASTIWLSIGAIWSWQPSPTAEIAMRAANLCFQSGFWSIWEIELITSGSIVLPPTEQHKRSRLLSPITELLDIKISYNSKLLLTRTEPFRVFFLIFIGITCGPVRVVFQISHHQKQLSDCQLLK